MIWGIIFPQRLTLFLALEMTCLLYGWKGTLKHMSLVGSTASPENGGLLLCHESNDEKLILSFQRIYFFLSIDIFSHHLIFIVFMCFRGGDFRSIDKASHALIHTPCVVETSHNWQVNSTAHLKV